MEKLEAELLTELIFQNRLLSYKMQKINTVEYEISYVWTW